jgi:hypothetical protein
MDLKMTMLIISKLLQNKKNQNVDAIFAGKTEIKNLLVLIVSYMVR